MVALPDPPALPSIETVDDLVRHTTPRIRMIIQQTISNPADVDDLIQLVTIQLWRSVHRYDPHAGSLDAWIAGITRHVILSFLRTHYRRPPTVLDPTHHLDLAPDADPLPLDTLLAAETAISLRAAIRRLPPPMPDLVEAAFFQGMTHHQLACRWNLPIGTIKTLLRRAQLRLRQYLHAHDAVP